MSPSLDEDKTELRASDLEAGFPCIEIVKGPTDQERRYSLREGKNLVGRSHENDIVLEDTSISRRHAVIEVKGEVVTIADLGSRNGTKIRDQKIEGSVALEHGTLIRMGLYTGQILLRDGVPEEVVPSPPSSHADEPSSEIPLDNPPQPKTDLPMQAASVLPQEVSPKGAEEGLSARPGSISKTKKKSRWILYMGLGGVLILVLILGGGPVLKKFTGKKNVRRSVTERPGVVGSVVPVSPTPQSPPPQQGPQPIFLEFSSSPIPAQVFFGDQVIGMTPFRTSTNLDEGKWYETKAVFQLPEIGEVIEEKTKFHVPQGASVIPVNFPGKIGLFKIMSLPRDAQLYLEGYFEKDPYRAKPIKFAEIVFGKPVYLPYGRYILELRKNRQIASSQTYLDEVVYQREFLINQDQTSYSADIKEETLSTFPIQLTSIPSGAKVLIDEKDVGSTPYDGVFPIGEHVLTLKKEGYFDYVQVVKMGINMPYVSEIALKTSLSGELINKADLFMKEDRFTEALPVLVEAFSKSPTPKETAQISYMVGVCYLRQKSFNEARDYFTKASTHPDFKNAGRLGLASVILEEGDRMKSLQMLVEVLVNSDDAKIRADAGVLFQRISPIKSVLYVASEPPGAKVLVNNAEMSEVTPLIIHDVGVGSYRILVRKEGYQESEIKLNLGVSEFRPVIARMKRLEDLPPQASVSPESTPVHR